MSKEISTEISPDIINSLILTGDMSKLTTVQQTQYYVAVCKSVGINPLTQPFAIIILNGKKILYATKGCTQQLADTRSINTEVKDRKTADSVYIVSVRATMKDGRFTDEDGIVSVSGLKGAELANAMMKAVTKAKRRAVLALCGLGMPDETEIEDIPHAAKEIDNGKTRLENIIEAESTITTTPALEPVKKSNNKSNIVKEVEESIQDTLKTVDLKDGEKLAQGFILNLPITAEVLNPEGKAGTKYNFIMEDIKYGTFDTKIGEELKKIINCQLSDKEFNKETKVLLNIVYKDRIKGDKLFHDIVRFSIATLGDRPNPI